MIAIKDYQPRTQKPGTQKVDTWSIIQRQINDSLYDSKQDPAVKRLEEKFNQIRRKIR